MDVRDLKAQHDALAKRFKVYEQCVRQLPPVEVLNELRYALRAAIEFIVLRDTSNPSDERDQELAKREKALIARMDHALKCAYHDLIDGFVIELTESLANLLQAYPTSTYEVVGSKVVDMRHTIREIEEVISRSRGNPERRAKDYENMYDQWFGELLEHRSYLTTAIPDIARLQEERDRNERDLRRRAWLMLPLGAFLGAVVSLVLTILWATL